jgi:plastocyanin
MLGEVRFRLPLPVILPIGSILLIALFAIAFSQILLNIPKEAATVVAIATAANLLIGLSLIATRPNIRGARLLEVLAVMLYPVIIGAGLAIIGVGEGTSAGEKPTPAAAAGGLSVTAANVQFNTDSLSLPAGEEATLAFKNDDTAQHNISIYDEQGGEELFKGDIVAPGASTDYAVGPFEPGQATYFQCDVHPSMNGDVEVS